MLKRSTIVAPVRVFLTVIVTVFAVEAIIMLGPLARNPFSVEAARVAMLDATILVAALCPVLWLAVVRPLQSLSNQRGLLLRQLFQVQEHERARMARDLHDEIGQAQTAVMLGLRMVLAATSVEQARERAQGVYELAAGAIDATRRLSRGLSPAVLTDFGLVQALQGMCADLEPATDIRITFRADSDIPRLRSEDEIAIYRIAQESVTNALRHARPSQVTVTLGLAQSAVRLSVTDDGAGLAARSDPKEYGGLGIAGMRERTALVGGKFDIHSSRSGTTVVVTVPIRPTCHE